MAVLKMQSVLQSACFHRKNTIHGKSAQKWNAKII